MHCRLPLPPFVSETYRIETALELAVPTPVLELLQAYFRFTMTLSVDAAELLSEPTAAAVIVFTELM